MSKEGRREGGEGFGWMCREYIFLCIHTFSSSTFPLILQPFPSLSHHKRKREVEEGGGDEEEEEEEEEEAVEEDDEMEMDDDDEEEEEEEEEEDGEEESRGLEEQSLASESVSSSTRNTGRWRQSRGGAGSKKTKH